MSENHHAVAYGQIELNKQPIFLNSPNDFINLSRRFYDSAMEYRKLCIHCASRILELGAPLYANVCFSCELFLKSLLLQEQFNFYKMKRTEDKHDLYDLFNHLDESTKTAIRTAHPCSNTALKYFDSELKQIGKGFEVLRYTPECRGYMVNVIFIFELMNVLAKICEERNQ